MSEVPKTKVEMLERIAAAWEALHDYLRSLSEEQRTQKVDAQGWMLKDFIIHLTTWEKGLTSALRKHTYAEGLEVDKQEYDKGVEHVNALLQQRYHHLTLAEALEMFHQSHEYLIAAIHDLSDDDLQRSILEFDPSATKDYALARYIGGDSYAHYDEHLMWLRELMASPNG